MSTSGVCAWIFNFSLKHFTECFMSTKLYDHCRKYPGIKISDVKNMGIAFLGGEPCL